MRTSRHCRICHVGGWPIVAVLVVLGGCDLEPGDYAIYRMCVGDSIGTFILYVGPESNSSPEVRGNETEGSDGVATAISEGETDVVCVETGLADGADIDMERLSGDECSLLADGDGGSVDPPADTEHVYVAMGLDADFPASSPTMSYQYGVVFDTDGDPANDYVPSPMYPSDFFAGTDRWYQLTNAPGMGWSLTAQDVVGNAPLELASEAMVATTANAVVLIVPTSELGDPADLRYRVSAFRHDGSWLAGDWNADVVPPVAECLRPVLQR